MPYGTLARRGGGLLTGPAGPRRTRAVTAQRLAIACAVYLTVAHRVYTSASITPQHAFSAVRQGDANVVREALDSRSLDINNQEPGTGQTLLMAASLAGQADMAKYLLSSGADWTIGEKDGYTPMHGAAFQGRDAVARVLLDAGVPADGGKPHRDGYPPIFRAVWGMNKHKGHLRFVKLMLDNEYVDIEVRDGVGKSLMDHALERGNSEVARYLMHRGFDTSHMTPKQRQLLKGSKHDDL